MELPGARYLHVFVPCPLGWGAAAADTIQLARLAHGDGPLPGLRGRARRGHRASRRSARRVPVEDYLRPQRRYAHLFGEPPPARRGRAAPGRSPTATSPASGCSGGDADGEAVRDHPGRRFQPRQQDRARWRTERPVYVDRLPPCSNACPAGENMQDWLYDAEEGDAGYERAWRRIMEDNPFPAVMGRVCYHPCETACNRGQLDEAVGINSVERFLGDEAIRQGWRVEVDGAAPRASACSSSALGPSGLSAAYHLARLGHERDHPRGRRQAGRHDALRHPALPTAARRPRRRDPADPRPRGHPRAEPPR